MTPPRNGIQQRFRSWLAFSVAMVCAAVLPLWCATTALAELDSQLSVVDEQGRTLTIQQWDTVLQGVHSIDRNRLSREWFFSGHGIYQVTGPDADKFEGQLS